MSRIEIEKTCYYCKQKFIAKTLTTKYCSHKCNSRHYKQRKREEKLNSYTEEQINKPNDQLVKVDLKHKEYLSISETGLLIGLSRRSIYRLIQNQKLQVYKFGTRTILKRTDVDKLFEQ